MHCAVLVGSKHIKHEERSKPEPKLGEILIKVAYVAICGSDQERYWNPTEVLERPVVFGHEFSGRVASTNHNDWDFQPDQPVTVAPLLNCGLCEFCRSDRENLCINRRRFGFEVDGALQDYVSIQANRVFSLPHGLPIIEGALVEPLAIAYRAARLMGFERRGNALVIGAGAIGLLIAQVWKVLGGGPVSIVDIDPARLLIAKRLGISTITSESDQLNFTALFEASGSSSAFSQWIQALAPGGRAIVVGKVDEEVKLNWVSLIRKEAEIFTSRYFTMDDFRQSIKLLENHMVNVKPLIGKIVPFEDLFLQQGRNIMEQAKQVVRLMVQM